MEDNESGNDVPAALYVRPEYKTVDEIMNKDTEDESLTKYKATLLGAAPAATVVEPNDPRVVLLKSIAVVVEGRPEMVMNVGEGDLEKTCFRLKEGSHYRLKFNFYVQREIVTGLVYLHKVYRGPARVASEKLMVGSYAPKSEIQTYISPVEEAPSGMLHRATYKIKSQLTDDDGHDWLSWKWNLEIAKDW